MKICVANFPWELDDKWGIRSGCRFPNIMPKGHNSYVPFPFFLAYTAACLERAGFEVLLIDAIAERCSVEMFHERVRQFNPDLVIAETATSSFGYDLAVLRRIRQEIPSVRTTLFGPHVSAMPNETLEEKGIDYLITGEPEETACELAKRLANNQSIADMPSLGYYDSDGKPRMNPRGPLIKDIDSLPYPNRRDLPLERYSVPGFPSPVVFMYASRGCPFKCTFCLWPQTVFEKGSYRPRAPEAIVEEMEFVKKEYPRVRSFFFDDDTFNLGRTRIMNFAQEMQRRKLHIPWGMNARADHWDRDMMVALKETGMFTLRIGIESGDQAIVDHIEKEINLEKARDTIWMAHKLGIQIHVSFIIGLPGECEASIQKTLKYIRSLPACSIQFSAAVPFPGTDLHKEVTQKRLLVLQNWPEYNGSSSAVSRTEAMTTDQINAALTRVRRQIYFSPRFALRRLAYVRNARDLMAIARKVTRLALPRKQAAYKVSQTRS